MAVMFLSLLVLPVLRWGICEVLDQPVEIASFTGANLLAPGSAGGISTGCRFKLYPFSSKGIARCLRLNLLHQE